jgi:hypothetical protein
LLRAAGFVLAFGFGFGFDFAFEEGCGARFGGAACINFQMRSRFTGIST